MSTDTNGSASSGKAKKIWKIIGLSLLVLVIATAGAFFFYVNDYYHADATALQAMKGNEQVTVTEATDGWLFDGPGEESALIFYPGAKVEAQAYAPLLLDLAEKGLDCFLVEMPFNLAIFGKDRAADVIKNYDQDYSRWMIGGHSLGGAMAASFASANIDELDGLALLAAYPTAPLDKAGFVVVSTYGSNDHVLNREKFEEAMNYMPADAQIIEIPGGNHAQFGDYGKQSGDGEATISAATQQEITTEDILKAFSISQK